MTSYWNWRRAMEIKTYPVFEKQIKRIAKKHRSVVKDYASLLSTLHDNPEIGDVWPDTNNARKVRMKISSKGQGKSGGARVVYYIVTEQNEIWLLSIYDKSDIETAEKKQIRKYVKDILTL